MNNHKEEEEDRVFHRPQTLEPRVDRHTRFANSPTTTTYLASTEGNKNNDHSIRSGESLKTLQGRKASAVNQEEIICEEENH